MGATLGPTFAADPILPMMKTPPICYICDPHAGARRIIAQVASSLGMQPSAFPTAAEMLVAALRQPPNVIFLDLGSMTSEGTHIIGSLVTARVSCPIQIISGLNAGFLESLRRGGERNGLTMLPVIYKPFRHVAIARVIDDLGFRRDAASAPRLKIDDALHNNWVKILYQHKVNLRTMKLAGAEALARISHPTFGMLPPRCFVDGADSAAVLKLTQFLVERAFDDWQRDLSTVFSRLRISLNAPFEVLSQLALADIARETQSKSGSWPGFIFEIDEDDVITHMSETKQMAAQLSAYGMGLSIGNCGAGFGTLSRLKAPGFTELKIDRSFVAECDLDAVNAGICETMIHLAHDLGAQAVGEGIEAPSELNTLKRMNCDFGQGYLLSSPLSASEFRQRFGKKTPATALGSAA